MAQYKPKVPGAVEAYRLTVPIIASVGDYVVIEGGKARIVPGKVFEEKYDTEFTPHPLPTAPPGKP